MCCPFRARALGSSTTQGVALGWLVWPPWGLRSPACGGAQGMHKPSISSSPGFVSHKDDIVDRGSIVADGDGNIRCLAHAKGSMRWLDTDHLQVGLAQCVARKSHHGP